MIKDLGGTVVDDVSKNFDLLISDHFKRTVKLCVAINKVLSQNNLIYIGSRCS